MDIHQRFRVYVISNILLFHQAMIQLSSEDVYMRPIFAFVFSSTLSTHILNSFWWKKTFICVLYLHLYLVGRYPPTLFFWWKKTFICVLYLHLYLVGRYPPTLFFLVEEDIYMRPIFVLVFSRTPSTHILNFFGGRRHLYASYICICVQQDAIHPLHFFGGRRHLYASYICIYVQQDAIHPLYFFHWWKKTFKYVLYLYWCLVGRHPPTFLIFVGGRRHLDTSYICICVQWDATNPYFQFFFGGRRHLNTSRIFICVQQDATYPYFQIFFFDGRS